MPGEVAAEPPKEEQAGEEEKKEAPASKPMVGIIYPPPEVRNIVDKTADFVARNGPEFEGRIRLNEAGNSKFNFLNPSDPYHAYYQHKIKETLEGVAQEMAAASQQGQQPAPRPTPIAVVTEPEAPKEPPPEWEYLAEPPTISGLELDVVKLTAQFVARNGAQFLDKLMMREQRNYQFDFLRRQHPLFSYFTKLVEQYSKVLLPPRGSMDRVKEELENPLGLLSRAEHRVDWEQYQARQKRKAEEREERERLEYAQVDWHDFVIVETINFTDTDIGYLPPPIGPSQLAQRLLQQQKFERMTEEGGEVQEIEMEVEEQEPEEQLPQKHQREEPERKRPASPPPLPPPPPIPQQGIQIRRDYNPKVARPPAPQAPPSQQFLISPITGEKIPAEKMQEHMRYGLLDPRWVQQQKRQVSGKQTLEEVFAEGGQIGSNLKLLAERRTDIFGVEETVIGQKIGEEEYRKKDAPAVQWDGHSSSAEALQRQAQSKVTIEQQLEHIQQIQGFAPDPNKERIGPRPPVPQPSQPAHPPLPPSSKPPPPPMPASRPILSSQAPMAPPRPAPLFSAPPLPPPPGARMPPPPGMPPPMQRPPLPTPPHGMMLRPPLMPNSAPPISGMPPHPFPTHPPLNIAPPVMKKPRTETEDLIPEQDFIAMNPGPVTFKLLVPNIPDRPEWKLRGQFISITLPITDPVSVIKAKVSDELGMPTGKQKLQIGSLFIKDSNSLGFYNISVATTVQLGLKERGGRKK